MRDIWNLIPDKVFDPQSCWAPQVEKLCSNEYVFNISFYADSFFFKNFKTN